MDKAQIAKIEEAYLLAEKAHEPQKRQSGEPYIIHPVAVATTLAELHLDPETIMAALMHDVIEDTPVAKSVIIDKFGETVAELVDGVSKLTQMPFRNKAELQAESFRKMILAMSKDLRVILVKLADRLHNMQTLGVVSAEKRRRVARETLDIYTPLASRLGMHKLRTQLEDLCFEALYPYRSSVLSERLNKIYGNRKEVISVISEAIERACKLHRLPHLEVSGREKHLYGIYKKMRDRGLSFIDVTDKYAFRIIVDNIEDCYRVLGYVHNLYKPVPERFKDYIAIPKANGYQSLHTTLFGPYGVPIEIQIRTRLMQEMAENGIAAHWLYKSSDPNQNTDARIRAQAWVSNLMEIQRKSDSTTDFIENFKVDLFPDEVYVFSVDGQIFELPRGATAIDLAYAMDSNLGNTCVAAKLDKEYLLLSSPLVNGQVVELICDKNAHPNALWLDFVVTSKAQSAIRHYLKNQLSNDTLLTGENLLAKALAKFNVQLAQVKDDHFAALIQELNLNNKSELFEKIGVGVFVARLIAERLANIVVKGTHPEDAVHSMQKNESLYIEDSNGYKIVLAECCYPIPEDLIIGEVLPAKNMLVHMGNCASIVARKNKECVSLIWKDHIKDQFAAEISVRVLNKVGMLNKLTTAITMMQTNIEDFYAYHLNDYERVLVLIVMVRDTIQLNEIMNEIRTLEYVQSVSRGKIV